MPTGLNKRRGDIHRDGDWHGAIHIWVGGVDGDGRPFALFQRRSASKDSWPGALDVAVGGHLRAGESLAETVREAEEEIGLVLRLPNLTRLGRRFAHSVRGADNEVQEVFALRSDLPLDRYRLHPDEVEGVVSIGFDEAIALFDGSLGAVPALELRRDAGWAWRAALDVAVSDLPPVRSAATPCAPCAGCARWWTVTCRSRSSFADRWSAGGGPRGVWLTVEALRRSGGQRLEPEPAVMLVRRVDDGERVTLCPLAEAGGRRGSDRRVEEHAHPVHSLG